MSRKGVRKSFDFDFFFFFSDIFANAIYIGLCVTSHVQFALSLHKIEHTSPKLLLVLCTYVWYFLK